MSGSFEIATWRFEQIAPAVDPSLSPAERKQAIEEACAHDVDWPRTEAEIRRGDPPQRKPIGRSTFYEWVKLYRTGGYEALLPKLRKDSDKPRTDRSEQTSYAIGLLLEEPGRSLTQVLMYLSLAFGKPAVSRSTLSRDLHKHPAYAHIEELRTKRSRKQRDRFEVDKAHRCWQLDGKGKFTVRFTDGTEAKLKVLSVVDCYSRAILGAIIAAEEDIPATVLVFTLVVRRWGLADRFQFDRGSAFDSIVFRSGLARLGVHRNWVKAKNPEAQGIIEAYHRSLGRWFINELRHQEVHNLQHLQSLLDAFLDVFYNEHRHDEIKTTPSARLAGRISDRRIQEDTLREAFWIETEAHAKRKTGKVKLPVGLYRVPSAYAGSRRTFRYDPVPGGRVVLVTADDREIEIEPFETKPLPPPVWDPKPATGQLQKLYDRWQGRERPNAQPGFGLPEVLRELGRVLDRQVPATTAEAARVRAFYSRHGPLPREAFLAALERTAEAMGPKRTLANYLDDLERQMPADQDPSEPEPSETP